MHLSYHHYSSTDQVTFVHSPECAPEGPGVGTVFLYNSSQNTPKEMNTVELNSRAILDVQLETKK